MTNEGKQEIVERIPKPEDNPQTELLREGAAIVRLENNTQMQIAIQRPRNEVKILSEALKELDTYPSMAEEVMYRKPVGKDPDSGQMKFAEGLSIRAAESLANRWTNSAYGCEILSEDQDSVVLAAVFMDYEHNTRHVIQKRVSKFYKSRDGKKILHPPDRFADVVVPANQSKILREVINRSLPAGLKQEYENKARAIVMSGDAKNKITKLIAGFIRLGVSKSKLEELAGKKVEAFTSEDIAEYIGIGNAIRDGETTVDQLIIEKTNAEKLSDRMKEAKPEPVQGPEQTPAVNAAAVDLAGPALELWTALADKTAGNMLEMNAVLKSLSGGKIQGREDLAKAPEEAVREILGKLNAKGKK